MVGLLGYSSKLANSPRYGCPWGVSRCSPGTFVATRFIGSARPSAEYTRINAVTFTCVDWAVDSHVDRPVDGLFDPVIDRLLTPSSIDDTHLIPTTYVKKIAKDQLLLECDDLSSLCISNCFRVRTNLPLPTGSENESGNKLPHSKYPLLGSFPSTFDCSLFSVATAVALSPRTLGGLTLLVRRSFPSAHSISTTRTRIISISARRDTDDLVEISW